MSYEPNEMVDGYDPSDPPQGNHWYSECSHWDEECTCSPEDEPVIKTEHTCPPIPIRAYDWTAWLDGREDGPIGHGPTERDAIANLHEALENNQ